VIAALTVYGGKFGLDQPHRLAQFLPQVQHESGPFN
jgi:putative chitinase